MWLIIAIWVTILQLAHAQNLTIVPIDYFNGKYEINFKNYTGSAVSAILFRAKFIRPKVHLPQYSI